MENYEAQTAQMNRQQICAALGVSESTIRRLEQAGLPFTPVGVRSHRYDLAECKAWLRTQYVPSTTIKVLAEKSRNLTKMGDAFAAKCKGVRLRVYPS